MSLWVAERTKSVVVLVSSWKYDDISMSYSGDLERESIPVSQKLTRTKSSSTLTLTYSALSQLQNKGKLSKQIANGRVATNENWYESVGNFLSRQVLKKHVLPTNSDTNKKIRRNEDRLGAQAQLSDAAATYGRPQ